MNSVIKKINIKPSMNLLLAHSATDLLVSFAFCELEAANLSCDWQVYEIYVNILLLVISLIYITWNTQTENITFLGDVQILCKHQEGGWRILPSEWFF